MTARLVCACAAWLLVAACGSSAPTTELVLARRAYAEALTSGTPLATAPMVEAQRQLNAAEIEHANDPGSVRERHLSYLATRNAQIAMARGDLQLAKAEADAAIEKRTALLELAAREERAAREKAERERNEAIAALAKFGKVTDEITSVSLTLSRTVLFELNEATLLPIARKRLDEVVAALKDRDPGLRVVIIGYTDSTGPEPYNLKLSLARAEAVRTYLTSRGATADLLVTAGRGEEDPVASNMNASGRANNRRVELVVSGEQSARAD